MSVSIVFWIKLVHRQHKARRERMWPLGLTADAVYTFSRNINQLKDKKCCIAPRSEAIESASMAVALVYSGLRHPQRKYSAQITIDLRL